MQQQVQINLAQTKPVKCESCSNETFVTSFMLRKASRVMTGSFQDQLIPIQVFSCNKCNTLVQELLPEELKTSKFEEVSDETPAPSKGKIILG